MAKSNIAATDILRHLFLNITPPWLDILEISLHYDMPGNVQSDSELTYDGYSRVKIPRNSDNWIVVGMEAVNKKDISFPICKNGSQTAVYVGIGSNNELIHVAELDDPIAINKRIQPIIKSQSLKIIET